MPIKNKEKVKDTYISIKAINYEKYSMQCNGSAEVLIEMLLSATNSILNDTCRNKEVFEEMLKVFVIKLIKNAEFKEKQNAEQADV